MVRDAEGLWNADGARRIRKRYPLHPPGKPERIRDEHLYPIRVPMLFLRGTADPSAQPVSVEPVLHKLGKRGTYAPIAGGDHSFNVRVDKKDAREAGTGSRRSLARSSRRSPAWEPDPMPRKNRRLPDPETPAPRPRGEAPMWAVAPGYEVRHVGGEKEYRCPGCDHVVRAGIWHLVVVPQDDPDARRHWHTECWRRELNRSRGRPRPSSF